MCFIQRKFCLRYIFVAIVFCSSVSALSLNQPTLCPNSTWDSIPIVIASERDIGTNSYNFFITENNVVYLTSRRLNRLFIWSDDKVNSLRVIATDLILLAAIFVVDTDHMYIGRYDYQWAKNMTEISLERTPWIRFESFCISIFVDIVNSFYCSTDTTNLVWKRSMLDKRNRTVIVAGNGVKDSTAITLGGPHGIYVDINFNLYVADAYNNRIQFFRLGDLRGITLIKDSPQTPLSIPKSISFDENDNMFIVVSGLDRIIQWNINGYRCIINCYSDKRSLDEPMSFGFDTLGNIFVSDEMNSRYVKFLINKQSCDCQLRKLRLSIRDYTSLNDPMEFRLNQEISLSFSITVDCPKPYILENQWILRQCNVSTRICTTLTLSSDIRLTDKELTIPSHIFAPGHYEISLRLRLITKTNTYELSKSWFIKFISSPLIYVYPIITMSTMISLGQDQELVLNPGKYSVDGDGRSIQIDEWNYQYSCRNLSTFPSSATSVPGAAVEKPSLDRRRFSGLFNDVWESSLTVKAGHFQANNTYECTIVLTKKTDANLVFRGFLSLQIQQENSYLISINCRIAKNCLPKVDYHFLNPSTQISLDSSCSAKCHRDGMMNNRTIIRWNVYQGSKDSLTNEIQWIRHNDTRFIFGDQTESFTATKNLFFEANQTKFWKFEVNYQFETNKTLNSSSSIDFLVNQCPKDGFCSISPFNGTTSTLFRLSCLDWIDEHPIKSYSFYVWFDDFSRRTFLGSSSSNTLEVFLPPGDSKTNELKIFIEIRDDFDCVTSINLSEIFVRNDVDSFDRFLDDFQHQNYELIGQILQSFAEQMNRKSRETNGISLSISTSSSTLNETNRFASIRERLISMLNDFPVVTLKQIQIQLSSLIRLTEFPGELTRRSSQNVLTKCLLLAQRFEILSIDTTFEENQFIVNLFNRILSNLFIVEKSKAMNGVLQRRTNMLNLDFERTRSTMIEFDEETNFEDENDFQQRIFIDQNLENVEKIRKILRKTLNRHLNLNQSFFIDSFETILFYERLTSNELENKIFQHKNQTFVRFHRSNSNEMNDRQSFHVEFQLDRLAPFGNGRSNTNYSFALSLSIFDQNKTINRIEFFIPRDPQMIVPELIVENVTNSTKSFHWKSIDLREMQINSNLSFSVHFEFYPMNTTDVGYVFTYRLNQLQNVTVFCPSDLTLEKFYSTFIDNERMAKERHQHLLIVGLRQLTTGRIDRFLSSIERSTSSFG